MGLAGTATVAELQAKEGFVRITSAGLEELPGNDVTITKEAPNYRIEC